MFAGVPAADFSNQVHDFNPGVHPFPSGLFWITRIDDDNVELSLHRGTASYHVRNLAVRDFGSIPNSLSNGASKPATTSFSVHWSDVITRGKFTDPAGQFRLNFAQTHATINWTASNGTDTLHSTSVTGASFAQVAHEANGVFFNKSDD